MEQPSSIPPATSQEIRRFSRLAEARERGLVLSACGIVHAIGREGDFWLVFVSEGDVPRATAELEAYEAEQISAPSAPEPLPERRVRYWSLPLVTVTVVGLAVLQAESGDTWMEAGILSADLVLAKGEWFRTVTALTLHGDAPHVLANLGAGLLFGGLLLPSFGQGVTWFLVVASGAVGNALTAWAYFPDQHRSVGASTAVFGALGLLVGDSLARLLQSRAGRSWWRWIPPLGAGVGLLAFLGTGEGKANVDVLAHLWGFAAGAPLGFCVSLVLRHCERRWFQWVGGMGALMLLLFAWGRALNAL